MPPTFCFRSYCSNSAANCLALWTRDSCVLFDCGIRTLRDCRALLKRHQGRFGPVSALVVSHAHGDHLSRQGLRALGEEGIPVLCHKKVVPQVRSRHESEMDGASSIAAFPGDSFTVGDFEITAIPLAHAPGVATFGFRVRAGHGSRRRTALISTDFHEPAHLLPHLHETDFVFIEANHDVELLSRNFNPNSRWHLSNVKTARLLAEAFRSGARPTTVVLGHLSEERNRESLAVQEVKRCFVRNGLKMEFELQVAPKFEPSPVIAIAEHGPLRAFPAKQGRLF
jgi:phosphoribosyl 1,2-cyclic phosphodiesterase